MLLIFQHSLLRSRNEVLACVLSDGLEGNLFFGEREEFQIFKFARFFHRIPFRLICVVVEEVSNSSSSVVVVVVY